MSDKKQYDVSEIKSLVEAASGCDKISDSALDFLSELEERIEFNEQNDNDQMTLTDKQYEWLDNLSECPYD